MSDPPNLRETSGCSRAWGLKSHERRAAPKAPKATRGCGAPSPEGLKKWARAMAMAMREGEGVPVVRFASMWIYIYIGRKKDG